MMSVAEGSSMKIQPYYVRLYTEPGVELAERNYRRVFLDWTVSVRRCAIVAVDCWNWHFSADTLARIEQISRERIGPLFKACRKHGLTIIHCPANPVAQRHPNFLRLRPENEQPQQAFPESPAWPPSAFRAKSGAYSVFRKPTEPQHADRAHHRETQRAFHPCCGPEGGEPVLLDGEDLHRYCAREGILHLFYVGFNTNACIMMRDYGLPAMSNRGYHTILLRDCTTGMETAETVESLTCTRGTIASIEQFLGFTMDSADLIGALVAPVETQQ